MERVSAWPSDPLSPLTSGTRSSSPRPGWGSWRYHPCGIVGRGRSCSSLRRGGGLVPREGTLCAEPVPGTLALERWRCPAGPCAGRGVLSTRPRCGQSPSRTWWVWGEGVSARGREQRGAVLVRDGWTRDVTPGSPPHPMFSRCKSLLTPTGDFCRGCSGLRAASFWVLRTTSAPGERLRPHWLCTAPLPHGTQSLPACPLGIVSASRSSADPTASSRCAVAALGHKSFPCACSSCSAHLYNGGT